MLNKLRSTDINALVDINTTILLLRLGAGALVLTHGVPKVMNVLAGEMGFMDPIGIGPELSLILAAFAEGICGFLVLIGLWTRLASIVLVIQFIVVPFFAHAGDPFGDKEKGLLFLVMFVVTLLTGGGKYSLDGRGSSQ